MSLFLSLKTVENRSVEGKPSIAVFLVSFPNLKSRLQVILHHHPLGAMTFFSRETRCSE